MDSLNDKSRIKIDVIAWINNSFEEFSNIFDFRYTNGVKINETVKLHVTDGLQDGINKVTASAVKIAALNFNCFILNLIFLVCRLWYR